ncbi:MAG: ribonuclease HI [Candidatus Rokuibacteriota bacterium]
MTKRGGTTSGPKSAPAPPTPASAARPPILVVVGSAEGSAAGPGGWGYVICYPGGQEAEAGGAVAETTGQRTALIAVIRAFERLEPPDASPVRVVSASEYLVDGASGKAARRAHPDLWAQLDPLVRGRQVVWEWEPEETMYLQERAAELAHLAVKRAR